MENATRVQHAERHPLRLILTERVEMALRYLDEKERRQVLRRLEILKVHSPESISGKFPPSLLVGSHHQSLLGAGSRHCYGINYTH